MRIEEGQAAAGGQILRDQIEQQRRFAGAGLADDVEMAGPGGRGEPDRRGEAQAEIELAVWIEFAHAGKGRARKDWAPKGRGPK